MLSIVRSVRNIAHRIIEEFMLAANEAVARISGKARRRIAASRPRKARSEESARVRGAGAGVSDIRWAWRIWRSGASPCGMDALVRKRARDAARTRRARTNAANERDAAGGGRS